MQCDENRGHEAESDLGRSVSELIASNRRMRAFLERSDEYLRTGLARMEAGEDPLSIFVSMVPIVRDGSARDVLKEHARTRHQLRLDLIGLCLDSGMSIGEIGRLYGFSRQMASRYAREVRGATAHI